MPVNINTENGNAVILSEEELKKIIEGLNTSLEDCIPESEVEW